MTIERQAPKEVIAKPSDLEVDIEQGAGIEAAYRMREISEPPFHRRRYLYCGMKGPKIRG